MKKEPKCKLRCYNSKYSASYKEDRVKGMFKFQNFNECLGFTYVVKGVTGIGRLAKGGAPRKLRQKSENRKRKEGEKNWFKLNLVGKIERKVLKYGFSKSLNLNRYTM